VANARSEALSLPKGQSLNKGVCPLYYVRHAPKPGEKIKQWSDKEIKSCHDAAKKIIHAYFVTLFANEPVEDTSSNPVSTPHG
jgi:hypothetical protein